MNQAEQYFEGDTLPANVFLGKYALRDKNNELVEKSPDEMHWRLADALADVESKKFKTPYSKEFIYELLKDFKYLIPQGSIMSGVGNPQYVSLSNCYVLQNPYDSYCSIMDTDEQLVQISKRRGGVGIDVSRLRPDGSPTANSSRTSTGIVSFCQRYSNSIREVGQCIAKGQRVLTKKGIKNIENVLIGDETWTKDGWVKVLNTFSNGKKNICRVSTKYGYSIDVSPDHIFMDIDLNQKNLVDFKVGESIILVPGTSFQKEYLELKQEKYEPKIKSWAVREVPETPKFLDEKLAYILGYAYGNGNVSKDQFDEEDSLHLAVPTAYPEIESKLIVYIKDVFDYNASSRLGDGEVNRLGISSKNILLFLKINGLLKEKSYSIKFPQLVIESSSLVQAAFLSGYLDADGDVPVSDKGKNCGYRICSVNQQFLLECQKILMFNGMSCKIHHEPSTVETWRDKYRVVVVGMFSQTRFLDFMKESYKVQKANRVSKRDCFITPYKAKTFELKYNKISYLCDNSQFMSSGCFLKLKKDGYISENKQLLIQDEIISIEKIGEVETFDLELESEHMFCCEGFYVHNSNRRGALMLTLDVHHPEVLNFVKMKLDKKSVTGANVSLRLSNEFLKAVQDNKDYELRWPCDSKNPQIREMISARFVWNEIISAAWQSAEPGLIFWDNIINESPADCYKEDGFGTVSTNPCSELPLCVHDSCRLLAINLFSYVVNPFTTDAYFDFNLFYRHAEIAQRLMDDIVDLELSCIDRIIKKIKKDPEPEEIKSKELRLWQSIRYKCEAGRRTGTGITALGDVFASLGVGYGTGPSIKLAGEIYKTLKLACYASSVEMAREIGPFPIWNAEKEKDCPFLLRIKDENPLLYDEMQKYGRRNIALLTTAPTGTVSLVAGPRPYFQRSSGIEPLFSDEPYTRRKKITHTETGITPDFIDETGDKWQHFKVFHSGIKMWMDITGNSNWQESPYHGFCANDIDWKQRVKLQSVAQKHIDHAISSTINLPETVSKESVAEIYETAWKSGCKGMTVYRDKCRDGVLVKDEKPKNVKILKQDAPKRPKKLPCDVYQNNQFFVIVGKLDNEPYETLAGKINSEINPEKIKSGYIVKVKRGHYRLTDENDEVVCENVLGYIDDNEEAITRMVSTSLRHGADIAFVTHQLEKIKGDIHSFGKYLARILKKYIKEGIIVSGESCPTCQTDSLRRMEGCSTCSCCGYSKCA